jgi:L-alanine-DL-glutamate epimerase-like enolase superfamily enzyme
MSRDRDSRTPRRAFLEASAAAAANGSYDVENALECTHHMSGSGLGFPYAARFASFARAHGPHQEYKGADDLPVSSPISALRAEKGLVRVPSGHGLGLTFDPAFLRGIQPLTA